MDIKFIKSTWGMSEATMAESIERIKEGGFDGVEFRAPEDKEERKELKRIINDLDLVYVGQQWTEGDSVKEQIESFKKQFDHNAELNPIHINSHTGKDWYGIDDNITIFEAAETHAKATGLALVHETHRGRAMFSVNTTLQLLVHFPELRICADFSHWCCVHESFLEDQKERIAKAISHADYFHARVGHTQSAQINDPRAPEWKHALEIHLAWWDEIVSLKKAKGDKVLYCCPEFGPYPYMPEFPITRAPLADLWDINHWMFQLLKKRYQ